MLFFDFFLDALAHIFEHLEHLFFCLFSLLALLFDRIDAYSDLVVDFGKDGLVFLLALFNLLLDDVLEARHVVFETTLELLYAFVPVSRLLAECLADIHELLFYLLQQPLFHLLSCYLLLVEPVRNRLLKLFDLSELDLMFVVSGLFISFNVLQTLSDLLFEHCELLQILVLPLVQVLVDVVHMALQVL